MNKKIAGLLGGLAGAITTTILHEILRRNYSGAPRLDKLGEEALDKTVAKISGNHIPAEKQYPASMAADIVSNTLYYSAAAFKPASAVLTGTLLGATAGLGAVELPRRMGLNGSTTGATSNRKLLTIGLYTIGGIVAGLVAKRLAGNGVPA
jgi:hypothetical protein